MPKLLALLFAIFGASQASAESCPDYFRFVDFGLVDRDGVTHRGGTLFRVESIEGVPLLVRELTKCHAVAQVASDGHGNPIPVVTAFEYDPDKASFDGMVLRLVAVTDPVGLAEANASRHRARLNDADVVTARGSDFLCARSVDAEVSCQIVSPYPGNTALVTYCDRQTCEMPALVFNDQIVLSAAWPRSDVDDLQAIGAQIAIRVQRVHDFLKEMS